MAHKYRILFLLAFFLLICNVSAITSDLKDNYRPGETVIIKIDGNILEPIVKEQVEFRKAQQINVVVPIFYDLKKLGDNYYLWFIAPVEKENMSYTLMIKSIVTTNLGQTVKINFQDNFTIAGNLVDYNILPGFIFTREDFSVSVNLNEDIDKTITVNFPNSREVKLKPGQNKLEFSTKDIKYTTLQNIKIGNYNFLAYINRNFTAQIKNNNSISISPSLIDSVKLLSDKGIKYSVTLENEGGNDIENLYLTYNKNLFKIEPNSKINLVSGESKEFTIELLSNPKNNITEQIIVKSDLHNISQYLNVNIRFISNYSTINLTSINNTDDNVTLGYYCAELGGKVCASSETCTSNLENSLDGKCCLSVCQPAKKASNAWVGYVLVLIAIGIIVYVYWNYKRVKANKSLLEKTIEEDKKVNLKDQNQLNLNDRIKDRSIP